jgi:hypothetical protein
VIAVSGCDSAGAQDEGGGVARGAVATLDIPEGRVVQSDADGAPVGRASGAEMTDATSTTVESADPFFPPPFRFLPPLPLSSPLPPFSFPPLPSVPLSPLSWLKSLLLAISDGAVR